MSNDIRKLQKISHETAIKKGFWGVCNVCLGAGYDIEECREGGGKKQYTYSKFKGQKVKCLRCEGKGIMTEGRNDGEMIALMHSELTEALAELRKTNYSYDTKMRHVGEELADCVIRIMDFCGGRNIDLQLAILKKIKFNKTRQHKHGKEF